jgi:hypothetical protein
MSDRRETDFLAYILAAFVFAIGGIAVGVASTHTASGGDVRPGSGAVKPAGAAIHSVAPGAGHRQFASQQHLL